MPITGLITTRAALSNMILCLLHHPEYQRKIQNELDDVIGRQRLPLSSDRHNLPMLEAVSMESQRYLTTGVVMAHLCNADINFEGFAVHKNSMVNRFCFLVYFLAFIMLRHFYVISTEEHN